jgi:hypothetical protein
MSSASPQRTLPRELATYVVEKGRPFLVLVD